MMESERRGGVGAGERSGPYGSEERRGASGGMGRGRGYGLEGRPVDEERLFGEGAPYRSRTGLFIDDGLVVLGILAGGAAGYFAASSVRASSRPERDFWGSSAYRGSEDQRRRGARSSVGGWAGRERRPEVERDETTELIASNKVEGTAVYDRRGEKLGSVHNFMVGKRTGRVAYAVMSFGGFLGLGARYHALPWERLDYDESKGGYVVDVDKDRLMNAPTYPEGEDPFAQGPDFGRRVRDYWSGGRSQSSGSTARG